MRKLLRLIKQTYRRTDKQAGTDVPVIEVQLVSNKETLTLIAKAIFKKNPKFNLYFTEGLPIISEKKDRLMFIGPRIILIIE